mgnify:FL=1|jgi:gliding motility-associated lipoprotein GldH
MNNNLTDYILQVKFNNFFQWLLLTLLLPILIFGSCGKQPVFHEYKLINTNGWSSDSSYVFNVTINNTVALYDLSIGVRHNGNYPYQNLWLFVKQITPDHDIKHDTIFCAMADYTGKWYGTGNGSIYTLQVPLHKHFYYDKTGTYQYSIVHGMRDDVLKGVNAIGLKLEIVDGEE